MNILGYTRRYVAPADEDV